jgi:ABC-type lipoprotein export system ATPase subunit
MQLVVDTVGMKFGSRTLFENLAFHVGSGDTLALMGPSGVGKSTLLSLLAGVAKATTGTIRLEGSTRPPSISWMFQNSPLLYRRSAIDNVAVVLELAGASRQLALDEASHLLGEVGLASVSSTVAHRLSGGERQRVAVARAIAARADLVLADEPTASLDGGSRESVVHALLRASRAGAALVVATHDPWVAERCDRVVHLRPLS